VLDDGENRIRMDVMANEDGRFKSIAEFLTSFGGKK
jgi:hypothetical protein